MPLLRQYLKLMKSIYAKCSDLNCGLKSGEAIPNPPRLQITIQQKYENSSCIHRIQQAFHSSLSQPISDSEAIDLWSAKVISVKEDQIKAIQDLLNGTGHWQAKRWFLLAHEQLHRRQSEWLYESLTIRYDHQSISVEPLESHRPGKRPRPRTSLPY